MVRLKKSYTSREVAVLTGLTARQLQGWDASRLVEPSIAPRRTEAGGFTERRYSPIELFELLVLADLRRRGFSVRQLHALVGNLRAQFGVRLFDAIEGGPLKLYTDGEDVYARSASGDLHSLVRTPEQPLLMLGGEDRLRELGARIRSRKKHGAQPSRREIKPSPLVQSGGPESRPAPLVRPGTRARAAAAGRRPSRAIEAEPPEPAADTLMATGELADPDDLSGWMDSTEEPNE